MKAFVARGMTLGPETSVVNLVSVNLVRVQFL
jgi:hypothetical protein